MSDSGKDLMKDEKHRGERVGNKGQELDTSSQCYSTWFITVLTYRTRKVTRRRRLILPLCMVTLVLTCYISTQHLQFLNKTGKLEKAKKTSEKMSPGLEKMSCS